MKTEKNILIAFILNLLFSILEFLGGIFTGSTAILSDALHDLGDALSIGISFFLEKKSKKKPDQKYSYGYARFSVLGSAITTLILIIGSLVVIYNAIYKLFNPTTIKEESMIIFAIVGVIINFVAVIFTHEKGSLNQKAVNLHMLEDMLGWIIVLVGAVVIKFTGFVIIDPIMSILIAIFILINAVKNIKSVVDIFLEKVPQNIDINEIKHHLMHIDSVLDIHHVHVWSIDGINHYATLHVVCNDHSAHIKEKIRDELAEHDIVHSVLEFENPNEDCSQIECSVLNHKHVEHCNHNHSHSHTHYHGNKHCHKHDHEHEHCHHQ